MKRAKEWFRRRHRGRGAAIWAAIVAVVVSALAFPASAQAATLDRSGFDNVPADQIQIDYPLSIADATLSATNPDFKVTPGKIWGVSANLVIYDHSVSAGTTLPGSFTLTWQNAGRDSTGSPVDLTLAFSNIYSASGSDNLVILDDSSSLTVDATNTAVSNKSVSMEISIKVTKHGTSTPASGTMLVAFNDIDVPSGEYSESVELLSGFGSTVWVPPTNFLDINSTATKFTATRGDENTYNSGFVTTGSPSGCSVRWKGNGCGTCVMVPFMVNEQSITASAGSHGSITDPGITYLRWKNDKTYTITPSTGYHVSNVTVDERSVGAPTSYTFKEVTGNHTIHADFAPNAYTVTFDGNGSGVVGSTASMSMTYDVAKSLSPNGFSRPGYTFQGWNTESDGSGSAYADGQTVRNLTAADGGTVTLYAQWKENPAVDIIYQVSDPEHASVAPGSESVAPATGEAAGSTATLDAGYRVVSWTDASGNVVGSGNSFTPSRGSDGLWHAGTYTANIEPIRYRIAYDANGGTGWMGDTLMTYDEAENLTSNYFTRTGYTFQGWATEEDGAVVYTDQQEVVNLTAEHDTTVTLYAVWKPITYTVVFESGADDATGATESMTMTYDEWDTLTKNGFAYEGHRFSSWVLGDGTDSRRAYADEADVRNLTTVDGDTVTLTAQWTVLSNRVTFVDHDGDVLGTELVVWGDDATAPEDPSRVGHTFIGWDKDYTDVKEPVTVTAQYRAHAYEVAFDANGGEGHMDNQPMTYGESETLDANGFTNAGHAFQGWATEEDGTVVYADQQEVVNLTAEDGGLVTLYAVWDEDAPVRVTYRVSDPEHASVSSEGEDLAPATGEAAGSTVAVDEGYRFTGWTDSEGNVVGTDTTLVPSQGEDGLWHAETYTAQVVPAAYEIAFDANGGEGSMDNLSMTFDVSALLTKNAFTRNGFTFGGWATEPESEAVYHDMQEVVNLTGAEGGVVTLYAVWDEDDAVQVTYKVSDPEHASLSSDGEALAPATGEAAGSTVTLSEGYHVTAWLDEEGNEVGTDAAFVPSRGEDGLWHEAIYTAQIAPARYQVAFDANGGDGTMDNQWMTYDVASELTENAFTRRGHTFKGWATEPEGEVVYEDMAEVMNLTAESGATVTLFAVWAEHVPVSILYRVSDPEHGTVSCEKETLAPLTGEAAGSTVTVAEGYRFTGWTDVRGNVVGADTTLVPSRGSDGQWHYATYIANIEPIDYAIVFNGNGGEGEMESMTMDYDESAPLTENAFTRRGHSFKGWATEPEGEVVYVDGEEVRNLTSEDGGAVMLYAVWDPLTFTVRFVLPDGTEVERQSVAYGEDAVAPENPELRGMTFTGWDGEFTNVTGDLTITAVFEDGNGNVTRPGLRQNVSTAQTVKSSGGRYGKTGGSDSAMMAGIAALALAAGGAAAYGVRQHRRANEGDSE